MDRLKTMSILNNVCKKILILVILIVETSWAVPVISEETGTTADEKTIKAEEDSALVSLWHLDEGKGEIIYDFSSNDNVGALFGATWCEGKSGKALNFNGKDNYVEIPHSKSFEGIENFTLRLWFKPNVDLNSKLGGAKERQVLSKKGWTLYIFYDGRGFLGASFQNKEMVHQSMNVYKDYNKDTWYYLAFVYDGSNIFLFENGSPLYSQAAEGIPETENASLRLGADVENKAYFNGIIDEIVLFKRAFSPTEIREDYIKTSGQNK